MDSMKTLAVTCTLCVSIVPGKDLIEPNAI